MIISTEYMRKGEDIDVLGAYGYNRVEESEIERTEESKNDSVH